MKDPIVIALSKGRIYKETVPLLKHAGIEPVEDPEKSRKLILSTNLDNVKIVIVRASDVPTYVAYGAADIGVAGKDVLLEHPSESIYEPLDLRIAECRLMTAGDPNHKPRGTRFKVATKYVNSAKAFYAAKGQQIEIIKLYGSMELAPIVGLADAIVDVVDTGNTLRANGLEPMEHMADISSRLIVNKASMKMKSATVKAFVQHMSEAVDRMVAAKG